MDGCHLFQTRQAVASTIGKGFATASCLLSLAVLSLCLLNGCGPFWVDPYITVKESHLNWMHINYYNLKHKPIRRTSVYIDGGGLVEVKKGTSELVSNDFAKRYREDTWGQIRTSTFHITPKQANDIFQDLVNHGVLDREKTFKASKKDEEDRFIAVKANINSNTYSDNVNIFKDDPDLAELLLDVVREFENPALR